MDTKDLLSKKNLKVTLETIMNSYMSSFLKRNNQNKCSEELITGMANLLLVELIKALDPWIPKEEKKEEVK